MSARRWIVVAALLFGASAVGAAVDEPDFARESRLAEQIVDAILDGDPVWLDAGGRDFLGIYTADEATGPGVVLLHGRGFHPDWSDAIGPLRVGLAERGYATLSLQMPVLEKNARYYDYVPIFPYAFPRIESGIAYLRERGHSPIILLAHSCGVHMAMAWLRQQGDATIDAFVGLGMGATDYGQPMRQPFPLERLRIPVLDLYGSNEFPAVLRGAAEREAQARQAGNPLSSQVILPDADHYFVGQGEALVEAVANWLGRLQ